MANLKNLRHKKVKLNIYKILSFALPPQNALMEMVFIPVLFTSWIRNIGFMQILKFNIRWTWIL